MSGEDRLRTEMKVSINSCKLLTLVYQTSDLRQQPDWQKIKVTTYWDIKHWWLSLKLNYIFSSSYDRVQSISSSSPTVVCHQFSVNPQTKSGLNILLHSKGNKNETDQTVKCGCFWRNSSATNGRKTRTSRRREISSFFFLLSTIHLNLHSHWSSPGQY